jgi:hypothetical protein
VVKVRRRLRGHRPRAGNPGQVIAAAFAVSIAVGPGLLLLPVSSADGQSASILDSVEGEGSFSDATNETVVSRYDVILAVGHNADIEHLVDDD